MSVKILVADDSKTIQKVVGITLSDTDYTVEQCLNENELQQKLQEQDYALVLLDFNLSDTKSGYGLVSEIKNFSPSTAVMFMLGTFDTVDEQRCREVGVDDQIIKPFESAKFIQKCRGLIENEKEESTPSGVEFSARSETQSKNEEEEKFTSEGQGSSEFDEDPTPGDGWVVDAPDFKEAEVTESPIDFPSRSEAHGEQKMEEESSSHDLQSEMKEWGMEVPGIIGEENEASSEFPPKIEEDPADKESQSGSLVGLDEMDDLPTQAAEQEDDSGDTGEFPGPQGKEEQDGGHDQELQLKEEVEKEATPEEFWAIDENAENVAPTAEASKEEEQQPSSPSSPSSFDEERIINEVVARLTPAIEEKIQQVAREMADEKIEKVAWEVIPDLAENLIKKEIKEISDSLE